MKSLSKGLILLVGILSLTACTSDNEEEIVAANELSRSQSVESTDQVMATNLVAEQGWYQTRRKQFYHHDQGSRLIQFSLYRNLEMADSNDLFRRDENIVSYQYLLDEVDEVYNPYGLPVGFSVSVPDESNIRWVGMTCAACHTGELQYQGTTLRVDGAPAMSHFQKFMSDLTGAVNSVADVNSGKYAQLQARVENDNALNSAEKSTLEQELMTTNTRLSALDNATKTDNKNPGGYGTLDAFGEIVNAVTGSAMGLNIPANLQPPHNPTSYPFLWYTPALEQVQWNGVGSDPMTRNLGEVLGVFGHFSLGTSLRSSAEVEHLVQLEDWLKELKPPMWNESLFGSLDQALIDQGKPLFKERCSNCHAVQDDQGRFPMTEPNEFDKSFVKVMMTPLNSVGTDTQMALDFVQRTTVVGEGASQPTACVLGGLVNNIKDEAYKEMNLSAADIDKYNGYRGALAFPPDWTPAQICEAILASLTAYKAGPLYGIWATAPFLHNGSIPNLRQLLLLDPRSEEFIVGNREFDPVAIGFVSALTANGTAREGSVFDTKIPGNSNSGHTYGTTLSISEREALIEYMKSL